MSVPRRPGLLAVPLALVLATSIGCSDSPMAPEEARATALQQAGTERELLLAVLSRLDSIEARVDRESAVMRAMIAEFAASAGVTLAGVPPENVEPGGGNVSAQLNTLKLVSDSIFELAGWIANEVSRPWSGLESCFGLKVKGTAELKSVTEGHAEGEGGLGVKPWDTGVLANVRLRQKLGADFGLGGELELQALGGCVNWGNIGASPPVRPPAPTASLALGDETALQNALMSVPSQLNLDAGQLQQMLAASQSLFQSGDLTRLPELATVLPVPAQFQNPLQTVRGRLQSFDAVALVCDGTSFGPRLTSTISQGCTFIQNNSLPNLGTYLNLGSTVSNLTSAVANVSTSVGNVQSKLTGVCNGLKAIFPSLTC